MRTLAIALAIISALILIPAPAADASGKISGQINYYDREQKVTPAFGLSIYEPFLFRGLNYNQWSGFGVRPHFYSKSVNWFVTKHALESWINRVGFSVGYQGEYNSNEGPIQHSAFFKLTYKLW